MSKRCLLIALLALAAGCGHGGEPSGSTSPAANHSPIATAPGTRKPAGPTGGASGGATGATSAGATSGGGSTTAPASVRMIAWSEDEVLPGNSQDAWIFFTDPGLDPASIDLLVNGKGIGNAAFQALSPSAIGAGQGTGQWVILTPMPSPGATLQLTGNDANGNPVQSNIVIVNLTPFIAQNGPPFFVTADPVDGATATGITPMLNFNPGQTVTTYNVVVLELTLDPATQTYVTTDAPVCVELAPNGNGPQMWTVGQPAVVAYSNVALKNPGHYSWQVVALDANGWGSGTSVDVAGFNAVGASNQPTKQVADTWPEFDTN